jgi:hypothetical protein
MSSPRAVLLFACTLCIASPAFAGGGGNGNGGGPQKQKKDKARKAKRMKLTSVVDKTVDGVVVERKLFMRSGGSKRKAKELTIEGAVRAMTHGKKVSDRAAPIPPSLTEKGRLVEKAGSYRERVVGARRSAVITLVRPGARHFTGPEAKIVYRGGRKLTVTRRARTGARAETTLSEREHSETGLEMLNYDPANQTYIVAPAPSSLTSRPGSNTVHLQGELHGLLINWDVSRPLLEGALEHGSLEDGEHRIDANQGYVTIQLKAVPTAAIALKREDVDRFLSGPE